MRRTRRLLIAMVALSLCTLVLVVYRQINTGTQLPVATATAFPVEYFDSPGLTIVSRSIQEITNQAELVLIGQLTPTPDTVNMARDVRDINREDQNLFVAGKVYQVNVERYIKGQVPNVIYFVQPESMMSRLTTTIPNAYERGKGVYRAIIPKANTRYLLFLHRLEGFPNQQYYTGGHPSRFDLSDPNHVVPEDAFVGAVGDFSPKPLATFLPLIRTISADLSVSVARTNVTLPSGPGVEYEITCANAGPDTATGVFVGIEFPNGLTFDHSSGGNFNAIAPFGGDWLIGDLPLGQPITLVITTRLTGGAGSTITFTAYTWGTSADTNRANNKVVNSFIVPSEH